MFFYKIFGRTRALELIQLSIARGFRDELMETQRKYEACKLT
jgi:hypothetical protein